MIYSSCVDDWGGSEELWSRSAALLAAAGWQVIVCKDRLPRGHPSFAALEAAGAVLVGNAPSPAQRAAARVPVPRRNRRRPAGGPRPTVYTKNFRRALQRLRPDLVLVSQAINFDGLAYAWQCLSLGIPYLIVSHKAVDFYWPEAGDRAYMIQVWQQAQRCFFVSEHNRRLTEEQFGLRLAQGAVIRNPLKTAPGPRPYPSTTGGYRLACMGRLFLLDKGQDMLLRVLAQDKWRQRPLELSIIGSGPDREGLAAMAALLGLEKVRFEGQMDPEAVWPAFHALVLPSRSEGLPLVIVEAMAAGRMVIVTRAGGNAEMVEDGVTGFVCEANERALDQALESAWARRDHWEAMGLAACRSLERQLPSLAEAPPEAQFVQCINALLHEST